MSEAPPDANRIAAEARDRVRFEEEALALSDQVFRVARHLASSEFRVRFEAKGRLRHYVEAIPSSVIMHADYTFVGLLALVRQKRGGTHAIGS